MILDNPRLQLVPKLKIATVLSYSVILFILIFSLATFAPSTDVQGDSSSWGSSWSTWTPFSGSQRDETKQYTVPSADGLSGDFIPMVETRASQGALKSLGQKKRFTDNLRDDKKYMTSFPVAGWNNQVICLMHLLYFSMRTKRIPIMPDFTPHTGHLNTQQAPLLRFGHVFDVPRLSALLESPIVEITELKSNGGARDDVDRWTYDDEFPEYKDQIGEYIVDQAPEQEDFGCWSWAKTTRIQEPRAAEYYAMKLQNTPLPERTIGDNYVHAIAIKPLIELLKPGKPITALDPFQEALISNHSDKLLVPEVLPSDDVTCVDELYFLDSSEHNAEFGDEPVVRGHLAWSEVGRHMYFSPMLRKITHAILRTTFGLDEDAKVPTYVAVHIRRTDFLDPNAFSVLDYSYYVAKVIKETEHFLGFPPQHVLVMTDETDEEWLAQLRSYGWIHIDHVALQTTETHGPWYTTLIDAVALSEGVGFVGLHQSSMAQLAYQRVRSWHGGVGRLIMPHGNAPAGYEYPYKPQA